MLKVVKVEPFILRVRRDPKGNLTGNAYMMCRVETEEGIVGWGEGTNFPKVATIATEIEMNQAAGDRPKFAIQRGII